MSPSVEYAELKAAMPDTYERAVRPQQSARAVDALPSVLHPAERVMPLWELHLGDQVVIPACPVGIKLRQEGDLYFAENDSLSIYASGPTAEAAISEFRTTAAFFVEEYRSLGPDEVVGLGVRLRELFLRTFPG